MAGKSPPSSPTLLRRLLPALGFMLALIVLVVAAYDTGYSALPPSEKRYSATREAVDKLKADAKRSQYRDQWLKLAEDFYDIYQRDSRWPNRPAALFRSAEVLEELGARSYASKDYKLAVERYEMVARQHSTSRLADDALLRAALIRARHLDDRKGALRLIKQVQTHYPRGDMVAEAARLEKELLSPPSVAADKKSPAQGNKEEDRRLTANAELTQVSWTTISKDKVQITVELNRHAPWQVRMRDADKSGKTAPRLILAMDDTTPVKQIQNGARIKGSLLTRVMVARGKGNTTELAFDFTSARRYDARVEQDPFRIVLTVLAGNATPSRGVGSRMGFAEWRSGSPHEGAKVAETKVQRLRTLQAGERKTAEARLTEKARAEEAALARKKAAEEEKKLAEEKANERRKTEEHAARAKGYKGDIQKVRTGNMAEQLGLTVKTVFIDAGHGGKDPGTLHNGIVERDLVLDIARRVGRLLVANGLEVVYSRTSNASVPLSARPRKANEEKSDLFVSIHINANNDASVSGFETFYLDLARNAQAAKVATLENAASDRKLGDMQSVLAEVMLNARTEESSRLAGDIQRFAHSRLTRRGYTVKDGGTRSAPFHVLIGAAMPAVLVEVGYCTNSREAKLMQNPQYRHTLAEGIAEGVMAYRNRLQGRHSAQFTLTRKDAGAI